ncbi:pisatin demethylase cytochrome P450 [Fusarium mundagurra]|uniref:Pisatin demethylase cytochrome P450 n=1 Tax=Fusarium mundagurra TaxID=1567541 RepID=A0A8H5Z1Q2_9HYPO|nr:pisatin demethylase cytochrome P450 [Fusarium mundagurra]
MAILPIAAAVLAVVLFIKHIFLDPLILSPLRHVPGPKSFAATKWRLAYEDWKGTRTRTIFKLHQQYGPVVRIGPHEVSFNSLSALRTIYGPGSRYGRTNFYRMFDVYGEQNLFTFHSPKEHGDRKKLLSHAYSKSVVLKPPTAKLVERRVRQYLDLIEAEPENVSEIFSTLHYYSLDNITAFVYGKYGQTAAIRGSKIHRELIADILHPSRRRLSWSILHLKSLTQWLYRQSGLMGQLVKPVLPMQQPTTYTGIRGYALRAFEAFRADVEKITHSEDEHVSIVENLWQHHESQTPGGLRDLQMASECADHFLAGIDTTSDTLMFLVWALSLPGNEKYQEKLREEAMAISGDGLNQWDNPRAEASDRCTYINAVIKETLRLYAPLPSTEPRSIHIDSVIDGYTIPGNTVVGMSPWIMHRNESVFKDPLVFNPDRWLGPDAAELNRWFWGFSSGGRMCIGMHLAMAEMTTLTATMYRQFRTTIAPGFEDTTPAITARVETFYDDRFPKVQESKCLIKFTKLKDLLALALSQIASASPCKPSSSTVTSVAPSSTTEASETESSTALYETTTTTEYETLTDSSTIATSVATSSAEAETTTTTTAASGPTNLINNPGFEDSTVAPWTIYNIIGTLSIASDSGIPPSTQAGQFSASGENLSNMGIRQNIDSSLIVVDKEYRFSIYTKVTASNFCISQTIACGAGTGFVNSANWGAQQANGWILTTVTCSWNQAQLDAGPSVQVTGVCNGLTFLADDASLIANDASD